MRFLFCKFYFSEDYKKGLFHCPCNTTVTIEKTKREKADSNTAHTAFHVKKENKLF